MFGTQSDAKLLPVHCASRLGFCRRKQEDVQSQRIRLNNGAFGQNSAWLGILLIHFHWNWNGLCWQAAERPPVPNTFVWLWCSLWVFFLHTGSCFLQLYGVMIDSYSFILLNIIYATGQKFGMSTIFKWFYFYEAYSCNYWSKIQ